MQIDGPRALVQRLIVAELLARPGTGPLARRALARRVPPQEASLGHAPEHEREPGDGERGP